MSGLEKFFRAFHSEPIAREIDGRQLHPRELSFKHTVQLWTEWTARCVDVTADGNALFRLIAQPTVGDRPGRIEPRARKRRPKPYPWLKIPRSEARERVRTYGHL